jgi:hypothetical protein
MWWIRIGFNADPDPAFCLNTDPDRAKEANQKLVLDPERLFRNRTYPKGPDPTGSSSVTSEDRIRVTSLNSAIGNPVTAAWWETNISSHLLKMSIFRPSKVKFLWECQRYVRKAVRNQVNKLTLMVKRRCLDWYFIKNDDNKIRQLYC